MQLTDHPFYPRLDVWERELCERLITSDLKREQLPFRVDSKIFTSVIVAAECSSAAGAILVVVDNEFADSWVTVWAGAGKRKAERVQSRVRGPEVGIVTPEDLKRRKRSFDGLIYSAIVIGGCVSHEDALLVSDSLHSRQTWRMIPQPDTATADWPLGAAGRALYLDNDVPYTFQPTVRFRPSLLAERAA